MVSSSPACEKRSTVGGAGTPPAHTHSAPGTPCCTCSGSNERYRSAVLGASTKLRLPFESPTLLGCGGSGPSTLHGERDPYISPGHQSRSLSLARDAHGIARPGRRRAGRRDSAEQAGGAPGRGARLPTSSRVTTSLRSALRGACSLRCASRARARIESLPSSPTSRSSSSFVTFLALRALYEPARRTGAEFEAVRARDVRRDDGKPTTQRREKRGKPKGSITLPRSERSPARAQGVNRPARP